MTKQEMIAVYESAAEDVIFVRKVEGVIVGAWTSFSDDATDALPASDAAVANYASRSVSKVYVSAAQLIVALQETGILDQVDAAVAQSDAMTQRLWARAAIFPRDDEMVLAIAAALGQTPEQLDDLFSLAATK